MSSSRSRRPARMPRWIVTYRPWGARRAVVRYFPNERRARAFYKKLWRRPEPPEEQDIRREAVPVGIGDMRILRIGRPDRHGNVRIRLRFRTYAPVEVVCCKKELMDYMAFRSRLLEQAGFVLLAFGDVKRPARSLVVPFYLAMEEPGR